MPLYEFRCCNHHVTEILLPIEHEKWQPCGKCEYKAYQIPSRFAMSCAQRETYLGREMLVNDSDDPWQGTPLEGGGAPAERDKLMHEPTPTLDLGSKGSPGRRGISYADRILLA